MIKSGMGNIALAYIKATVVLAHSQGRLKSLAGIIATLANNRNTLIEQSPSWYTKDQRL